jgi:hypothetical protein
MATTRRARVFRLECRAHGMGPYGYLHDDSVRDDEHTYGCHSPFPGNGPTPNADRGIYRHMLPEERCAFGSLAQALAWFCLPNWASDWAPPRELADEWCIAEYLAPVTARGRAQVLYLADGAERVDRWVTTDILEVAGPGRWF